jgi:tRNA A-37 threonylcarbamoyl transferase component Bud32
MTLVGDIVQKTGEASLLAVEAAKAARAFEIGKNSGLFRVPRVVGFDAEAGLLEFERLDGLVTLLDLAIRKDPRLFDLLKKAGRSLAVIHKQLILPDEMKHELPQEWTDSEDQNVFIHGDFATVNVCFHEQSNSLVIVDWSAAPLIGRTPTFGSRYFDILWFVNCLFCGVPNKKILNWDAEAMAEAFLEGYAQEASSEILNRLPDYQSKIHRLQKQNIQYLAGRQNSPMRKAAYIFTQVLMCPRLKRFLRNHS